jgi:hypothetical protein
MHIGGAVLYKAQRSGIFRAARVVAITLESVTIAFPRCGVERTVAWSAVVAFDAGQLDQQWKPPELIAPVVSEDVLPDGVATAAAALPHAGGFAVVRDAVDGPSCIGSRIPRVPERQGALVPGTHYLP